MFMLALGSDGYKIAVKIIRLAGFLRLVSPSWMDLVNTACEACCFTDIHTRYHVTLFDLCLNTLK